jgi:methionyl-tRNA formyltransferase
MPFDGDFMSSMGRGSNGRLLFVGAVHEAEPALAAIIDCSVEIVEILTMPPAQEQGPSGYVNLEPLATAHGIPVRRTANINAAEEVEHIRQLAPDVLVVVGWTRLLGAEVLAIPPRGCIGFHASLLPRFRGRAPVNWAILRGERETGNTMMYLNVGTDTGDIIDQRHVAIEPTDTCASVYTRVAEAGAQMLRDNLPAILDGTAARRPQERSNGDLLPKRTPAMGITDWDRPTRAVHDWIRALTTPYPGAFAFWAGHKVMLWASDVPDGNERIGRSGEVIARDENGVRVGTADGSLLVTSLSTEGSPPQAAFSWACENGMEIHDRFESVDGDIARWALGLEDAPVDVYTRTT